MSTPAQRPVAVIGAGSIGLAFALVFARAGRAVRLYDVDRERLRAVPEALGARLADLAAFDLLDEAPAEIARRITATAELAASVRDAGYVQELSLIHI